MRDILYDVLLVLTCGSKTKT